MSRYIARLVFRIHVQDETIAQFDEQLRLIEADNSEKAFEKAIRTGQKQEDEFSDVSGDKVQWAFINVSELFEINELKDETEIYSFTHEENDETSYIEFINLKAQFIQKRINNFSASNKNKNIEPVSFIK